MSTRIVIADDHPMVQAALRSALVTALPDLDLIACRSVDEVLEVLSSDWREVDLVLLDLTMPGTDGFAGLFLLHAHFPTLPVAIVSARQDAATIQKAITFGASGYIPKSLDLPEMASAIGAILEGEIWTPSRFGAETVDPDAAMSARLASLSSQQLRILTKIIEGKLNKQIAGEMEIAEQTVKVHVSAILKKLGVVSRTQAAVTCERLLSTSARDVG
ncbi:DNA-binding response regulator [Sinorhizobium fredii]|uniref:DNA-binding response regulator n=1 Tax=Rhizobium fredii TaxID=380 RepID=A0A2A6LSJ1_RHIFR|nr:response regulator transcription factor [Sinorhizobium fredii]PDT45250.1 DNA-binding response regulator [Sinorhizobium fredii]